MIKSMKCININIAQKNKLIKLLKNVSDPRIKNYYKFILFRKR
jgi:hypothetical protein